MMRIREDQVVDRPFKEIWPQEVWPSIDENVAKVLSGGHCSFDSYRMNGSAIAWWNVKMTPIENDGGKVEQFIVVSSDITERYLNEEALRKSKERFRQLSELLPIIIYEMDLSAKVTYINRAAFETFGFSPQDFYNGVNGLDLITPQDRAKAKENLNNILAGAAQKIDEYIAQRKDGSTFAAIFRTSLKIQNDKPEGFRGVIIDISDKKRLEERLLQAQKMEAIGTLAGGIAHDFNNILSAVIGYADLGKITANPQDPLAEYFREIHTAGQRASMLIKQILAFSRQDDQDFFPVQITSIIKEAVKLLRATIPATIEIKQKIDPQCEDILIMADQTKIHQVLMNLCTNAFHSMRQTGGLMEVALSRAKMFDGQAEMNGLSASTGPYLLLEIKDTGPGIEQDILARIFEPYFTTKERDEGTGLGLAVVDGIVQKHGGEIKVISRTGGGTTFQVYLPITEINSNREKSETVLYVPGGTERLMFVDDEEAIIAVNQKAFFSLGYEVTTTLNGMDALQLLAQDPDKYDLVMTDMSMPKMNGAELTKRILQIRPDMPIIICTGYSELINEDRAAKIGAKAYVMKPVVLTDMAKTIRRVLDGKS